MIRLAQAPLTATALPQRHRDAGLIGGDHRSLRAEPHTLRSTGDASSYLSTRCVHTIATKKSSLDWPMRKAVAMSDDRSEEIPLVPRDERCDAESSVSPAAAIPDADKRRLEGLLRELLRDGAVRELLCVKEELALQQGDAE